MTVIVTLYKILPPDEVVDSLSQQESRQRQSDLVTGYYGLVYIFSGFPSHVSFHNSTNKISNTFC